MSEEYEDEHEDDATSEVHEDATVETDTFPSTEEDLQDEPDDDETPSIDEDPSEL